MLKFDSRLFDVASVPEDSRRLGYTKKSFSLELEILPTTLACSRSTVRNAEGSTCQRCLELEIHRTSYLCRNCTWRRTKDSELWKLLELASYYLVDVTVNRSSRECVKESFCEPVFFAGIVGLRAMFSIVVTSDVKAWGTQWTIMTTASKTARCM